jgi:cystathionine beta-synthase
MKILSHIKMNSILESIGNTLLVDVKLNRNAKILAKLEFLNPGGSVKDRSALYMIEKAEKNGLLKPGGTIIEASSGNQGIALAMIGAAKGYKVIITASEKISKEKLDAMKAYGAKVIICPSTRFIDDPKSYHSKAKKLSKQIKNSFMPDQYFNIENPAAHYKLLGPEIWKQTNKKITHFFAAAGTTGTISGVGKFLKEKNPKIKVIAVDSATSYHATNGKPKPYKLEGIGIDFETPCLNKKVIDEFIGVTDKDAINMMKTVTRKHGLIIGPSSGAVAYAVSKYKFKKGDIAIIIFADSGRAYLSKGYF